MGFSKGLVLGLAYNYHPFTLERFLSSLRRSNSDADVVLFVGERDESDANKYVATLHRAELIPVKTFPYHIQMSRFLLYQEYLREHKSRFADALIFGEKMLQEFENETVICSGTTIGNYAAVMHYLELMNQHCTAAANKELTFQGVDQAVHNLIVHKQQYLPHRAAQLDNENGPINTMHYASKRIDPEGRVINDSGEVSYVAHQLDRMPSPLIEEIGRKQDLPVFDLVVQSKFLHGEE